MKRFRGVLAVVVAMLTLGAAPAFGEVSHALVGSFDGSETPAGSLGNANGVAVDSGTGDVYVADIAHDVVDKFTAAGVYLCQITGGGLPSLSECNGAAGSATGAGSFSFVNPAALAVDNSTSPGDPSAGDLYVIDREHSVIDKFSPAGAFLGELSGFEFRPLGLGVDASGNVWVDDIKNVYEFDSSGNSVLTFESETNRGGGFIEPGLAVDSGGHAYVDTRANLATPFAVEKFSPTGTFLDYVATTAEGLAVAVDLSTDDLYVDVGSNVAEYDSAGNSLAEFGAGQLTGGGEEGGIAVNPVTGTIYVANPPDGKVYVFAATPGPRVVLGAATSVTGASATVGASVNPLGSDATYQFEYGTSVEYGQRSPAAPVDVGSGSSPVPVSAALGELQAGTTYHYRVVASNANGGPIRSADGTFTTLPAPAIDSASTANVSSESADLSARIDPRGYDTTYHFEYGPSTGYGTSIPIPDGDIGAGTSGVAVSQHVVGLQAGATYHWRVVARNANGVTTGVDHTFVYSTGGVGLPDNRAYEMVTPPMKNAALIGDALGGIEPDIAEDGSRVMIASIQCFADSTSCPGHDGKVGTPFAFTRESDGWEAHGLAPSATQFDTSDGVEVNANTDSALFRMRTTPGGELDWFARRPDGSFVDIGPYASPSGNIATQTGTADLSHIAYQVNGDPLYEYVGVGNTAPMLVGVSGGAGSTDLISACGAVLGSGGDPPYQAMSGDGRTVFFTASACASGSGVNAGVEVPADELFARVDESRAVPLSLRSPLECTGASGCLSSPPGNAMFVGASDDGSKAFFLDTQRLTDSASEDSSDQAGGESCERPNGVNGCNLYEYDLSAPAGRNLVAVSAGDSSGGGPRVQGVLAISADGSHVYFVARGVLTGVANERGQLPRDGAENMYVFERDAGYPNGRVAFIASVPESDDQRAAAYSVDDFVWRGSRMREDVTPDGRFLVFTSGGTLTADDTSSTGAVQVFRYDALTGALVRISIGENGFNDNGNAGLGPAGIVAPGVHAQLGSPRGDPTMSHDGSFVFFESPVGLTPGALNNVPLPLVPGDEQLYAENVYEWHEGHVYLISDGRDANTVLSFPCAGRESDVCLLGADATGRNVFFLTADPLVAADKDLAEDVYDARVCSASEPCVASAAPPPVGCQGEGCHGTPAGAPALGGAATVTFSGPGNLAPPSPVSRAKSKKKALKCAKGKQAKHGKCVKKRKRKKASTKRAKSTRGGKK